MILIVLVELLFLLPFQRYRMEEHDIPLEYMKQWPLIEPCHGLTGVGKVLKVGNGVTCLKKDDLVSSLRGWSWQLRQNFNKNQLILLNNQSEVDLYSYGISSLTGYLSVLKADCVLPAGSQTAVVSTCAGSVGFVTAQVLSLMGCDRVIGLTSTTKKCDFLMQTLNLDSAVNYKSASFAEDLAKACPKGVDIFVDLVGGSVSNTVKSIMRKNGHILTIGSISTYQEQGDGSPPEEDDAPMEVTQYLRKNKVKRHNFAVFDMIPDWPSALNQLKEWANSGDLKLPITRSPGLESAATAFISMMSGGNIGKQIVQVSQS